MQGGRGGAVAVPDSREPIVVVDVGPCTECAGQAGGGGRGGLCQRCSGPYVAMGQIDTRGSGFGFLFLQERAFMADVLGRLEMP